LSRKNDELHVMLKKVVALSITDPLTELYDRGTSRKFRGRNLKKSGSYHACLSCLMMVIDQFKNVYDTCGHSVGDTISKDIAWIIKQGIRDADTLSRWGVRSSSCWHP
jgi:diguanylate cyclase (GGDEF)-like protein